MAFIKISAFLHCGICCPPYYPPVTTIKLEKNLWKDERKRSPVADRWAAIALHTVSEKGDRRYLPAAHVSVDTKVLTVFCIHADVEFTFNVIREFKFNLWKTKKLTKFQIWQRVPSLHIEIMNLLF